MGLYNRELVRLMAKEITVNIGLHTLYSNNNPIYPNAPENFLLADPNILLEYVKKTREIVGNPKKIIVLEDPHCSSGPIYGMYVAMDDSNYEYIIINHSLNLCWKRFSLVKEFCSLYIDIDSEDGSDLFDDYLDSVINVNKRTKDYINGSLNNGDNIDSETFSILLATELMIPERYRSITKKLIESVGIRNLTMNDVAKSLLIPEYMLQRALKDGLFNEEWE